MLAQRTLLLADDSPTVQKVVSLTFGDEGMKIVTAGGGGEALAQLEQTVPDVVLADVHMPAPNGYELCARIKRDARLRHVPVLLLVGAFEPFDEAEARRVGADDVLTKPFQSIRELVSKVSGLLGGHAEPKRADEEGRAGEGARAESRAEARLAAQTATPSEGEWGEAEAVAPAFANFDLNDDESIQSVPAADFVARRARRGYAAAAASGAQATASFDPRGATQSAEDTLLDLDEVESPRTRAAADDDLILDIEDDAAAAQFTSASEESHAAADISPANLSSAWSEVKQFEISPQADTESIADRLPEAAPAFERAAAAEAGVEVESAPPAPGVTAEEAHATFAPQAGEAQLSPEAIDAIARRVVEHLSERVLREIAWEVVPELAERLIRRRLEEERARTS